MDGAGEGMRGIIRKEAKVQKSSFNFYFCRCFRRHARGGGFKNPRFHRTIRRFEISVPATGFSILGTEFSVAGTVQPRCRMGWHLPCWDGRTAGERRGNGVGVRASMDGRARHCGGGRKSTAEGLEGFEFQTLQPFLH